MLRYKYVIVGGGMTADAAVQGIRELDLDGNIAVISAEKHPPYDRPPLSIGLWKKKMNLKKIDRNTKQYHVDMFLERTVQHIDGNSKIVFDDKGMGYYYDQLLLATGGKPRRLKMDNSDVIYYRTIEDYEKVVEMSKKHKNFCVVGGGFIGAEMAAALCMNKNKVTMIFPENGICGQLFPEPISNYLTQYYREKGVTILTGESVVDIQKVESEMVVITKTENRIVFDCVIAGIGILPNVELAETVGIPIQNGIIIDEHGHTAIPNIYAAGDVANFECKPLGKRIRVEHEDNANTMGQIVGRNMAGALEEYNHLPSFYSDMFEIGYEAVGEINANMEVYMDWVTEFQEGVIYFLENDKIHGVLLWNVWDQLENARNLIRENKTIGNREELKNKIQNEEPELLDKELY